MKSIYRNDLYLNKQLKKGNSRFLYNKVVEDHDSGKRERRKPQKGT